MLIRLIRNQSQGSVITGRLVINGQWFCNTLERVGYQIPALCYHLAVTQSPKFRRLLPIVQNVPQRSGIRFHRGTKPEHSTGCILVVADNINDNTDNLRGNQLPAATRNILLERPRDIDLGASCRYCRSYYPPRRGCSRWSARVYYLCVCVFPASSPSARYSPSPAHSSASTTITDIASDNIPHTRRKKTPTRYAREILLISLLTSFAQCTP